MGFNERYSDEERDALASAFTDRGIRPAARVVALANAGELEHNGERLPPFETNQSTVRSLARQRTRQRMGTQRPSWRRARRAMPSRRCVAGS